MQKILLIVAAALTLASCGQSWKTDYADVIDPAVSRGWRVTAVNVTVPRTLTVSEEESYTPDADIVWREDELGPTDRYQQVDAIMTNAIKRGASGLRGSRPVHLNATVAQFHALSNKTRQRLENSGIHNIVFDAQVVDARTGAPLSPVDRVYAEFPALAGSEARAAMAQGQTQKVRITNHVAAVTAGWLGSGPDVRQTFSRLGR